ncbi:hypothetical protein, conserved [Eimeria tenella]|uniref:Uncharacterized protein n=1 Tax=Eimeria tenella TaxID=5802 RepID=U6KXQ1_EIMTE|nr:hypothetical protein, conserved [Eimeria tenella]CDJ41723.1 hypothetical protein, conserved [Eimeria tenella]|eukprot:XP_013232473.1 hypothetical protein, conserved [Eimeria tenella]
MRAPSGGPPVGACLGRRLPLREQEALRSSRSLLGPPGAPLGAPKGGPRAPEGPPLRLRGSWGANSFACIAAGPPRSSSSSSRCLYTPIGEAAAGRCRVPASLPKPRSSSSRSSRSSSSSSSWRLPKRFAAVYRHFRGPWRPHLISLLMLVLLLVGLSLAAALWGFAEVLPRLLPLRQQPQQQQQPLQQQQQPLQQHQQQTLQQQQQQLGPPLLLSGLKRPPPPAWGMWTDQPQFAAEVLLRDSYKSAAAAAAPAAAAAAAGVGAPPRRLQNVVNIGPPDGYSGFDPQNMWEAFKGAPQDYLLLLWFTLNLFLVGCFCSWMCTQRSYQKAVVVSP